MTVEPGRVIDHRRVAARPHIGQDIGNRFVDVGPGFPLGIKQFGEGARETRIARIKPQGHRPSP